MNAEEITESLDKNLKGMPWVYKHWKVEESIEVRNTGEFLDNDRVDEMIEQIKDEMDDEDFRRVFEGKLGLMKENGDYWKTTVDAEGGPGENKKRIDEDEVKGLIKESLTRGDSSFVPSNQLEVQISNIKDIYLEKSGGEKYLNIKLDEGIGITLRNDGGLQVRSW